MIVIAAGFILHSTQDYFSDNGYVVKKPEACKVFCVDY